RVDLRCAVLRQVGEVVAGEVAASRKELREAGELIQGDQRRWSAAPTGSIQTAVRTLDPWPAGADPRVAVEELHQALQRAWRRHGIRVEQQRVAEARPAIEA